jgi:predicted O-methyltransferase YrrM
MIYFRTLKYLRYILLSRHGRGHGIHSPFIYDLVSRVFQNRIDQPLVNKIEQIREKMKSDRRSILVNDLGSKSDQPKTNLRKVSDIVRHSPVTSKYGNLLSNMAAEFGKPLIIELGTSLGISTLYMAASCEEANVITIEGCKEIAALARQNIVEAGLNNINILEGSFDEILAAFPCYNIKPGLIFIDGNHRKEAVIKYFNLLSEISGNNTVFIIDNINYSRGMAEAWNELKLHKNVSVSIDIFRMGILFFRAGINHNNYVIRY